MPHLVVSTSYAHCQMRLVKAHLLPPSLAVYRLIGLRKPQKNSSKIEKATLCGQCGHKMRKLRSETLVMLEFMAEWTTQH